MLPPNEALADVGGVNVHAGAAIDGRDRKRLERLCRYIARPPLPQERLEEHGDGRLRYRFKRVWRNGAYAVVHEPLDLVARLVALIPPPRFHMLRYHGVLAAHAKARGEVVPGRAASTPIEPVQLGLGLEPIPVGQSRATRSAAHQVQHPDVGRGSLLPPQEDASEAIQPAVRALDYPPPRLAAVAAARLGFLPTATNMRDEVVLGQGPQHELEVLALV